jgi:SAM-dependent methyltransferase
VVEPKIMADKSNACRSCRAKLETQVLDLGAQPVADVLLDAGQLAQHERALALRVFVCDRCGLVQLPPADVDAGDLTGVHGHGAAHSSTVRGHVRNWANLLIERLGAGARVLDVASGDGALLRPFMARGMSVLGIEPNAEIAGVADVPTRHGHFGLSLARSLVAGGGPFDLILVNHALAHAANLDDFVAGLACALRPGGGIALEFHHALSLVRGQFDVVCHAHRSYLSLHALEHVARRHDLAIVDAELIQLHGGSVRATLARAGDGRRISGPEQVYAVERCWRLDTLAGYNGVAMAAAQVRVRLLAFLEQAAAVGASVVGYGAPSRGITLLNYCGVSSKQLAFTVDRSSAKQDRFLPGSRIPVLAPDAILAARPDFVLILPWALSDEIVQQLADVRGWGGRFVVAVPELRILD